MQKMRREFDCTQFQGLLDENPNVAVPELPQGSRAEDEEKRDKDIDFRKSMFEK
jgi:hypothetical protein